MSGPFSDPLFRAGGYGALERLDGWCTLPHPSNMAAVPVEVWERSRTPTIESNRLLPTPAAGQWRGGLGQEVILRNGTPAICHHPLAWATVHVSRARSVRRRDGALRDARRRRPSR
jgi:hypothetical protein